MMFNYLGFFIHGLDSSLGIMGGLVQTGLSSSVPPQPDSDPPIAAQPSPDLPSVPCQQHLDLLCPLGLCWSQEVSAHGQGAECHLKAPEVQHASLAGAGERTAVQLVPTHQTTYSAWQQDR